MDPSLQFIVSCPVGGLGNTLFNVAAGYTLAQRLGKPFFIKRTDYTGGHCYDNSEHFPRGWPVYWDTVYRHFETRPIDHEQYRGAVHFDEPTRHIDFEALTAAWALNRTRDPSHYCLFGYYQHVAYFDWCRMALRERLVTPPEVVARYLQERYQLEKQEVAIVAVRQQTDYRDNGWCLPLDYYRDAWQQVAALRPDRVLAIADDPAWATEHLAPIIPGLEVIDESDNPLGVHPSVLQFYLMMRARFVILANSTFHWWGAYLAMPRLIVWPRDFRNDFRIAFPPDYRVEVAG